MKIRYFLMGAALVAMTSVSFTACSDDDDDPIMADAAEKPELTMSDDMQKVKIGPENRIALPIEDGAGEYHAYSLNPEIADITYDDANNPYIEGFKKGYTSIVVSDASGTYKCFPVSVYITDNLTLSHTDFEFVMPLGLSATNTECHVIEGNGEYTIKSNNEKVAATINPETGEISLTATSGRRDYTATLTVTDVSGLTGTINVTVKATFDGFIQSEIDEILAQTKTTLYGACKEPAGYTQPYMYFRYDRYNQGTWYDEADGEIYKLGWWYNQYESGYGGLSLEYPASAAVGEEVTGTLLYMYNHYFQNPLYTYEGKVKILENSDTRIVVLFWNVDLEHEFINRAYFVKIR